MTTLNHRDASEGNRVLATSRKRWYSGERRVGSQSRKPSCTRQRMRPSNFGGKSVARSAAARSVLRRRRPAACELMSSEKERYRNKYPYHHSTESAPNSALTKECGGRGGGSYAATEPILTCGGATAALATLR